MQVTHVQDHVTHAVIGANTAQSFGMSDDPEFFNILSKTLYTDYKLAVIREGLCNAWDAHIESGRTNIPIEITLNQEALIIRDRGTGIPNHLMHAIYCVYGKSTKKHDGKQTGGFGLGCKSPFAYTDHFEVTNYNAATKTIYRISKSSGEVGGRPGMVPIISLPTDEHGIQVKIEIKSPEDVRQFNELIHLIVRNGQMNATLNGELLETLPFSEAKEGFLITNRAVTAGNTHHRIFVRYGNVIYPVEENAEYRSAYQAATDLLGKLAPRGYSPSNSNWKLVLQAKPNTISVAPSREALSMSDHTIEALGDLLTDFQNIRDRRMDIEATKINEGCVQQAFLSMKPVDLLNTHRAIVGLREATLDSYLTDFGRVAREVVSKHYPSHNNFRKRDVELRLRSLIASGYGNRGKIQSYLADYLKLAKPDIYTTDWFHRRLVAPLIMGMKGNKDLVPSRLLVYGSNDAPKQRRFSYDENQFAEATKFSKSNLEGYLPFLRNLVILSYNRDDVLNRAENFPQMRFWFGGAKESLIYVVQRSDPKVEAAQAYFAKMGFNVLDLTKRHKGEVQNATESKQVREYKPRKKGIPLLSSLFPDGAKRISTDLAKADDVKRIEAPEFILKIGARNNSNQFGNFGAESSEAVVRLFGSKGGIVVNETQEEKYVALGAKKGEMWILEKVIEELTNNKRIHKYRTIDRNRLPLDYWQRSIIDTIMTDEFLRTHYDISADLTEDDRRYLCLWEWFSHRLQYARLPEFEKTLKLLNSFPVSPQLKKLGELTSRNSFIEAINWSNLEKYLEKPGTDPELLMKKAKARDILIYALKG